MTSVSKFFSALFGLIGKVLLSFAAGVIMVTLIQAFIGGAFNYEYQLSYKLISSSTERQVSVAKVENTPMGTIYHLDVLGEQDLITVSESVYCNYIAGTDRIILRTEQLVFYIQDGWIQELVSDFFYETVGITTSNAYYRSLERISYPWDEEPIPFSLKEIEEVALFLTETKNTLGQWDTWEKNYFSFDFDKQSYGSIDFKPCDKGATKYEGDEIRWWWRK